MNKILLAGSTGYLGSYILRELLNGDYELKEYFKEIKTAQNL